MITLDFISIIKDNEDISIQYKFIFLIFLIPKSICLPLEDVINKILLSDDFLLPHTLMFYRGLIEFIILFIISFILFLTGILNLEDLKNMENIYSAVIFKILNIIIYFIQAFCLMKVIYIFTSQYVSFLIVSESLAGTLNFLININNMNKTTPINEEIYLTIELLSLFIVIFGTLMYNEMIIINKWGLQENTKKGLLLKEQKESNTINVVPVEDNDEDNNNEKNNNNDNIINDIDSDEDDNYEDDKKIKIELKNN